MTDPPPVLGPASQLELRCIIFSARPLFFQGLCAPWPEPGCAIRPVLLSVAVSNARQPLTPRIIGKPQRWQFVRKLSWSYQMRLRLILCPRSLQAEEKPRRRWDHRPRPRQLPRTLRKLVLNQGARSDISAPMGDRARFLMPEVPRASKKAMA